MHNYIKLSFAPVGELDADVGKASKSKPTLVYCGNDAKAKCKVAGLISELGFEPLDLGKLESARYIEPFSLLVAGIAYDGKGGAEVSYRIHRT